MLTALIKLVELSRTGGAIRLPASASLPGFAVTITAGHDSNPKSQTKIILPAAIKLLPSFANDHRVLTTHGKRMLVREFVRGEYPLWYYNQVYTAVLYMGVPLEGFIDLKVGTPDS